MAGNWRTLLVSSVLGLVLACAAGLGLRGQGALTGTLRSPRDLTGPGDLDAPGPRVPYDPQIVPKTIDFWKAQADRDPEGALELRELAGAYLARLREAGDVVDAVKAEEAARRSLKILTRGNAVASTRLARSLLAQHRFP